MRGGRAAPFRASLLAVVLLACACTSSGLLKTELIFGLSKPSGDLITDDQWLAFVDGYIAPRFPVGFTVVDALGHYLSHDKVPVRERSKILILVYPSSR